MLLLCVCVRKASSVTPKTSRHIAASSLPGRGLEESKRSESRPGNRDELRIASSGPPSRQIKVALVLGRLGASYILSMRALSISSILVLSVGSSLHEEQVHQYRLAHSPILEITLLSPWFGKTQGVGVEIFRYGRESASGWSTLQ